MVVLRLTGFVVVISVVLAGAWLFAHGVADQWFRWRHAAAGGLGFNDPACAIPFCDFPLFWEAGRLALLHEPQRIYGNAAFLAATNQLVAPHANVLPFPYPPPALLLAALMSLPPVVVGYYFFSMLAVLAGVSLLRLAGMDWRIVAVTVLGLPAMWNLYLGQFGFLCCGLLVFGLMRLARWPVVSGVMLAGLCIKPQYAILIPVVVLASRNVRAMVAGAAALGVLLVSPALAFGWQTWSAFWGPGRATMQALLQAPFQPGYEYLGASMFWLARSFGSGVGLAYALQMAVIGVAAALCWLLWRRPCGHPPLRVAMTLCLVLIANPHAYTDDLVAYSLVLPMLARRQTPVTNAVLALLWLAPSCSPRFVEAFGFLPMPFCLLAAGVIAFFRLRGADPALRSWHLASLRGHVAS
jgi:hypothetical protein